MFTKSDFEIFDEPTLPGRMNLIKTVIDPKFEAITPTVLATLATASGDNAIFYPHIAKHLRRFKNPPVDTWVAFSENKRSYKALPHFELGFWPERLFIYFDILDESKASVQAGVTAEQLATALAKLPSDYLISNDHSSAKMNPATAANIAAAVKKFGQYKHSELVLGRAIEPDSDLLRDEAAQHAYINETFTTLMPIYQALTKHLALH